MTSPTGPVDWGAYPGELLEQVMAVLLLQERRRAQHRRPSRGDGGVDVYDPVDDGYHVYQVKRHSTSLTARQKTEIKASFTEVQQAPRLGRPIRRWSLVLPLDPTSGDDEWFAELTKDATFACEWLGRTFWDSETSKHPHVVDYYLRGGKDRLVKRVASLTSLLLQPDEPLQPGDLVPSLLRLRAEVNRDDPHYVYDLHLTHETPEVRSRPGLVLTRTEGVAGDGYATVDVFAKYPQAVIDRPIAGNMTLVLRDESQGLDLIEDWQALQEYGRTLNLPATAVRDVTLDAPGGLGGSFEGLQAVLTRRAPVMIADEIVLRVAGEDAIEISAVTLTIEHPPTVGSRGLRLEAAGPAFDISLELEMSAADRTITTNLGLSTHELTGERATDALPHLQFLSALSPPNRVSMSIRKRSVEIGTGSINVASILAGGAIPVAKIAVRMAEMLSELDELLGIPMLMPSAVDQRDIETLTWAWTLARGETVDATWSEGRLVAERPDELVTALKDGGVLRIDAFESFRFAGSEYPLGVISRVLFGAVISDTREGESGTEVILRADHGRAEERLLQAYGLSPKGER
ncbi:MAG: hypothetical protein ACYCST_20795 [Acidimicrobiales bacterium]